MFMRYCRAVPRRPTPWWMRRAVSVEGDAALIPVAMAAIDDEGEPLGAAQGQLQLELLQAIDAALHPGPGRSRAPPARRSPERGRRSPCRCRRDRARGRGPAARACRVAAANRRRSCGDGRADWPAQPRNRESPGYPHERAIGEDTERSLSQASLRPKLRPGFAGRRDRKSGAVERVHVSAPFWLVPKLAPNGKEVVNARRIRPLAGGGL